MICIKRYLLEGKRMQNANRMYTVPYVSVSVLQILVLQLIGLLLKA